MKCVLQWCDITEAYHPEAINSDPMLGFFSEPIKIYFLIWSVSHSTSWYCLLCGSNGRHGCCFRVDQLVCRFSTFFCAHQRFFLELLVQYQAYRLLKSSIAGKHFFVICFCRVLVIRLFGRCSDPIVTTKRKQYSSK